MILDADCLGFDKESIYGHQGFHKKSYGAYLGSRLRSTIESFPFLQFKKVSFFIKVPFLANIERCPKFLKYSLLYVANTCH